jgi:hypothetical protein
MIRLVLITLVYLTNPMVVKAEEKDTLKLESISETDLSFFTSNPKLPWGDDPFEKQPGYALVKAEENPFKLDGILYNKKEPIALINGKSLKVGERVKDRTVVSIGENFVVLKKKDSEIELVLPPISENVNEELEYYEADEEDGS